MLSITGTQSISATSTAASVVGYTISGLTATTSSPPTGILYEVLAQGWLSNTGASVLYTPGTASVSAMMAHIAFNNTSSSVQVVPISIGAFQTFRAAIPALGSLIYEDGEGFSTFDQNGFQQYVGSVGPQGLTGATGATGPTGPQGTAGSVSTINSPDGTITVITTSSGASVQVERPQITGQVVIPAGSNAASITPTITPGGPIGSASVIPIITWNAAGQNTTVSSTAIVPTLVNGWIDVSDNIYANVIMNNATTGAATANVTALNAIFASAPGGSCIYFPPGNVYVSAALTAFTKDFAIQGVHGASGLIWVNTPISNTNLITLWSSDPASSYTSIRDMLFQTFVTMTNNYVIDCGANINTFIEGCIFTAGGGDPFAGCITFSDATNGGNGAVVRACFFEGWTGTAINVNGLNASPYFSDLEMIGNAAGLPGTGHSTNGIACPNGGAVLMVDCGIVQCMVNVNLTVTTSDVVASIFAANCFFDQGVTNCLLISGPGTAVRCHFIGCWFTMSPASLNAACIAITTSGSSIHEGIEFVGCWIVNISGAQGASTGASVTAAADFNITNCQIGGWTNGVIVGAAAGAQTQPVIQGNDFGSIGGASVNTTALTLNAGTYGSVFVTANDMTGNKTNIVDSSSVTLPAEKSIINNLGTGKDVYFVRNTASTIIDTVTMTAIPGLTFPIVQPNLNYAFEAVLSMAFASSGSSAAGVAIAVPAGATIEYSAFGNTTGATVFKNAYVTATATTSAQVNGFLGTTPFTGMIRLAGVIQGGTATSQTGGVSIMVNGQTGSISSVAGSLTVLTGCWFNADKVA